MQSELQLTLARLSDRIEGLTDPDDAEAIEHELEQLFIQVEDDERICSVIYRLSARLGERVAACVAHKMEEAA